MKQNRQIASFQTLESRTLMSASPTAAHHLGEDSPTVIVARPAAATNLAASVAGLKVTLTWTDNATNETGYQIYRMGGKGPSLVGSVAANSTTFTDNAALVGNDVYVVRAFNKAGNSEGSPVVTVHVNAPLVAPKKLTSAAVSTTSIKLTWSGDCGATGGYMIERRAYSDTGEWAAVGSAGVNVRTFTDTGLTAGTKYVYRITAISATGDKAVSALLLGMTKATDHGDTHKTEPVKPPAPPAPPHVEPNHTDTTVHK